MDYKQVLKWVFSLLITVCLITASVIYGMGVTHTKVVNECNEYIKTNFGYLETNKNSELFNFNYSEYAPTQINSC